MAYKALSARFNKNRANRGFAYLYRSPTLAGELGLVAAGGADEGADPLAYLSTVIAQEWAEAPAASEEEAAEAAAALVGAWAAAFPPLAGLSVPRHVGPKLRFALGTLCGGGGTGGGPGGGGGGGDTKLLLHLPPGFFGARLEK